MPILGVRHYGVRASRTTICSKGLVLLKTVSESDWGQDDLLCPDAGCEQSLNFDRVTLTIQKFSDRALLDHFLDSRIHGWSNDEYLNGNR